MPVLSSHLFNINKHVLTPNSVENGTPPFSTLVLSGSYLFLFIKGYHFALFKSYCFSEFIQELKLSRYKVDRANGLRPRLGKFK